MPDLKRRIRFVLNLFVVAAAFVWRRLLFRTTVIAVTGSMGKTTAKECIYSVLSSRFPAVKTIGNRAGRWELPRAILRTRPWHRFLVAEVAIDRPGIMRRSAFLLRPDVVVFLCVRRNHSVSFPTPDDTAEEKAKLLWGMSRRGTAVLNADDPRIVRIAQRVRQPIVWFSGGESSRPDVDCRAEDADAAWPRRLSFTARCRDESQRMQTQLVGVHWTTSVVAAITVGRLMGLSLAEMAEPLAATPTFEQRMEPVVVPSGAVVVRDEYNGSVDSLGPALDVLRDWKGGRRILMISDIADLPGNYRQRLRYVAEAAAPACDLCLFVGPKADYGVRRAREQGMADSATRAFKYPSEATSFLLEETGPGDVVLLRGRQTDGLEEILQDVPLQPAPLAGRA